MSVPFARWWRLAHGDQYPVDQLRGGPDRLHLLRALLRIRLAVSLADIADADSGPAVAIQFRSEVRPDGAGNRPVAVSAVPVPAPDHHALLKLQWPKYAGLWGQLIVFMGSFIAVTNPPVYDYAAFSMII